MPARLLLILLCGLVLLVATTPAQAFRVLPMTYDLTPVGSGSTQLLRVENLNEQPLTVELFAERRLIHEDGSETRTPADDDFIIFPPQAIIAPTETRAFRVQYIGEPRLDRSVTYAVTVAQLPVELESLSETGVQFVFNFSTLANVVPPDSRFQLEVLEVTADAAAGTARLRVANQGTRYGRVTEGSWTFTNAAARRHTLAGEALREAVAIPLIQPGTTRLIELPLPPELLNGGAVQATFTADQR